MSIPIALHHGRQSYICSQVCHACCALPSLFFTSPHQSALGFCFFICEDRRGTLNREHSRMWVGGAVSVVLAFGRSPERCEGNCHSSKGCALPPGGGWVPEGGLVGQHEAGWLQDRQTR
jgi:hypothetical protein